MFLEAGLREEYERDMQPFGGIKKMLSDGGVYDYNLLGQGYKYSVCLSEKLKERGVFRRYH